MADARLDERLRFGRRTPADAARYRRSIHLAFAMIAAIYVIAVITGPAGQAAGAGGGARWLLPWVLGVLLVRITAHLTIQIHEYVHCVGPERADLLIRVFPAMIGPLTGYREVHLLHTAHHEHLLGREDPDLGVMVGRPVWSYLRIFFYHEYFFIHYLRHEGQLAGPGHVVELAGRALIFTAAALSVPGWTLLLLLLSTRLAFSTAYFLLSWYLHREGPCVGTYRKPMPAWLAAVVWALGGRPALATLRYHDLHHRFPELDVGALERVARVVPFDRAAATAFVLGPCPHPQGCARCGDAIRTGSGFQARSIQSSGA